LLQKEDDLFQKEELLPKNQDDLLQKEDELLKKEDDLLQNQDDLFKKEDVHFLHFVVSSFMTNIIFFHKKPAKTHLHAVYCV